MAYLPGFDHNVFLSYAHEDAAWVDAFRARLDKCLRDQLGPTGQSAADIWLDKNNIRIGQKWPDELAAAVRASAAFVAILSRSYEESDVCALELKEFLDSMGESRGTLGGYGRFMKILQFPWLQNRHERFYPQYQSSSKFFYMNADGIESAFEPSSDLFLNGAAKVNAEDFDRLQKPFRSN